MSKADWLRSEIEKLEGENERKIELMGKEILTYDCDDRGYYQALTSIITRYKEELKVLEK